MLSSALYVSCAGSRIASGANVVVIPPVVTVEFVVVAEDVVSAPPEPSSSPQPTAQRASATAEKPKSLVMVFMALSSGFLVGGGVDVEELARAGDRRLVDLDDD